MNSLTEEQKVGTATDVETRQRRGLLTVIGAFVLCPCHLPLTLGLLVAALGGTGAGVYLHHHVLLAGAAITLSWGALTWRGIWLMRKGASCPVPMNPA